MLDTSIGLSANPDLLAVSPQVN